MADERGLQAERTVISWSRTAAAFAANGALPVLRLTNHHRDAGALLLAGTAFALAGWTVLEARRRQRTLMSQTPPRPIRAAQLGRLAAGICLLGTILIADLAGLVP
jgi:uncharacterized membrane protein YidH (DUF202 family)